MRRDLPSGTVTFLFTDVEGSTKLLHELGAAEYAEALAEHRRVLREVVARHGGIEVDTQGDAFFIAFDSAPGALAAALRTKEALGEGPILVRMGLHTGTPHLTAEGYVGEAVHKGSRIAAAGHGGQILLSAETRGLVDGELMELGEHRLKDFDEPIAIFQAGSERFPPLKTISNTNLPRPASSFVGREANVQEVVEHILGGARFVTLTGPGGSGKTRLAIEAATALVPEFKAGVFWVGLAPVRDHTIVAEAIAKALGAKDALAKHVGERELFLLLDNFEQVVEAAPELASLAEACPNLTLLVTSRELLRVRGEVEYPVLPLPDPEAVELFCARAGLEADDDVRDLCVALDNLPLAIELAAARASVLSPKQIHERLERRLDLLRGGRDADPRQQTLRATIEWSYELLSPEERTLFARLGVFRGGCTLEAAEDVAGADLDVLQSLADKSLVRRSEDRYWMLETIREYALECLDRSPEAAEMPDRHAAYFLGVAEEPEPLDPRGSRTWLDRLEREHDNLRAALDWFTAVGAGEQTLRMAAALANFWAISGHLAEATSRLDTALRKDLRATPARAKALGAAAETAFGRGDVASARAWAEDALSLHQELGDDWGTAESLRLLAVALAEEGNWLEARAHAEQSVRAFSALRDERYTLAATRVVAWTYYELGERDRAWQLHEENLKRARESGDAFMEAVTLGVMARLFAIPEGRIDDGISLLRRSLVIWREAGDRTGLMEVLFSFADALAADGRAATAATLLSRGEALKEEIGGTERWVARMNERTLAKVQAKLDDAEFAEAWETGQKLTSDEAVALAVTSSDEHKKARNRP
jgi:predicted ATPase